MLPTYVVGPGELDQTQCRLTGDEGRHAARVARVRAGELVRLIDGSGTEAAARVLRAHDGLDLEVIERRQHRRDEGLELVVGQALLKGRDFDSVVRRLAELGVARVVPLITSRVVPDLDESAVEQRLARWRAVSLAATKQSRGVFLTDVSAPVSLEDFTRSTKDADARLVAWEECDGNLLGVLPDLRPSHAAVCVVGPEGGLEADEVAGLQGMGFVSVSLGRRVLRADWAAAALAMVLSQKSGGLLP
jgi:16S rRNA (uracil1498-N3)-methyltransferase